MKVFAYGLLDSFGRNPAEVPPAQKDELKRLMQEIERHGRQVLDLMMELALPIDEAGQWDGPPLDRLLNDDNTAARHWRNLANVLKKVLANSE